MNLVQEVAIRALGACKWQTAPPVEPLTLDAIGLPAVFGSAP